MLSSEGNDFIISVVSLKFSVCRLSWFGIITMHLEDQIRRNLLLEQNRKVCTVFSLSFLFDMFLVCLLSISNLSYFTDIMVQLWYQLVFLGMLNLWFLYFKIYMCAFESSSFIPKTTFAAFQLYIKNSIFLLHLSCILTVHITGAIIFQVFFSPLSSMDVILKDLNDK